MELMEISCHSYPFDAISLHRKAFFGILVGYMDCNYVMTKKTTVTRREQGHLSR
jgi:hypothetical protein